MGTLQHEVTERLNYAKAHSRDKARTAGRQLFANVEREIAMLRYVTKHKLSCFKCGAKDTPWAKTGTNHRGPWAICTLCATNKRSAGEG